MSSWTAGVAVAVSAMIGAGRSSGKPLAEHAVVGPEVVTPLRDAVRLVDGDERRLARASISGKPGTLSRSGAMNRKSSSPSRYALHARRESARSRPEWIRSAAKPRLTSCATWSSISAMSGLTTSVVPPRATPGSW